MKELVPTNILSMELDTINQYKNMAVELVKSSLVPACFKKPEDAWFAILYGREVGLTAMQSLMQVVVVNGRMTLYAETMLALVKQNPEYGGITFDVQETQCTVTLKRRMKNGIEDVAITTFSETDAKKAGLMGKDNYQKHPKRMYRARALAWACKEAFPDLFSGIYTPEEIEELKEPPQMADFEVVVPQDSAFAMARELENQVDLETKEGEMLATRIYKAEKKGDIHELEEIGKEIRGEETEADVKKAQTAKKVEIMKAHRDARDAILYIKDEKIRNDMMLQLDIASKAKDISMMHILRADAEEIEFKQDKSVETQAEPVKEEPKPEPTPEPEQAPEPAEDENFNLKQEIVEVFAALSKTGDYEIVHLNNSFKKQTGLQYDGTDWKAELLKADIGNETLAKALEYWKDALDRINKRNQTSPAPAPAPDPEPADDSKMRQEAIELAKTIKEKKRRDDFIGAIGMVETDDEIKFVMSAIMEYKQEKEW